MKNLKIILVLVSTIIFLNINNGYTQNIIDQYTLISKLKKSLYKNEYQEMFDTNRKLEGKFPYSPIVYWYDFQWYKVMTKNIDKQYENLEKTARFYSTLSDKDKKNIDSHFTLQDINNAYRQLDRIALKKIEKECSQNIIDIMQKHRKNASIIAKVNKATVKCAYLKVLENPSIAELDEVIERYHDDIYTKKAIDTKYKLQYNELMQNYNLKKAINFYYKYPKNTYKKAIEFDIFQWFTADGHPDSFFKYAQLFSDSYYSKIALNYGITIRQYGYENETRNYEIKQDSIRLINRIKEKYVSLYQNNQNWEYLLDDGSVFQLPRQINDLAGGYSCDKSIPFLVVNGKSRKYLYNLSGQIIKTSPFNAVETNKFFLILNNRGKYTVSVIGVNKPLIVNANEIEIIDDTWIKYTKNNRVGLVAINGYDFNGMTFDEINIEDNAIIITNGTKKNIFNTEQLPILAQNNTSKIDFPYDDIYNLYVNRFLVTVKGKKGIIDSKKNILLKTEYLDIKKIDNLLLLKTPKELLVKDAYTFNFILETQEVKSSGSDFFHRKQDFWLTPTNQELAADNVVVLANKIWKIEINGIEKLYFSSVNKFLDIKTKEIEVKKAKNDKMIDIIEEKKTIRMNYKGDTVTVFNGFIKYEFNNAYYLNRDKNNYNTGFFIDKRGAKIWAENVDAVEKIDEKQAIGKQNGKYYIYELDKKENSTPYETKPKHIEKTYFYYSGNNTTEIINTLDIKNKIIINGDKLIRLNLNNDNPYFWVSNKGKISCYLFEDIENPIIKDVMVVESNNDDCDIFTSIEGKKGILCNSFLKQPEWDNFKVLRDGKAYVKAIEINDDIVNVKYFDDKGKFLFDKTESKKRITIDCR